jgi:catechol 2,3-dioxygenase-like lactoylglutathione lyase family enzyme
MAASDKFDHIGFTVSDIARSKAFYDRALAPLGIGLVAEVTAEMTGGHAHAGYGHGGKPYFWIGNGDGTLRGKLHVAFTAANRPMVDAYYQAAMAAGGVDNGPPGLRPHYHANYYGAFVLDPDGHNIEACCHLPE